MDASTPSSSSTPSAGPTTSTSNSPSPSPTLTGMDVTPAPRRRARRLSRTSSQGSSSSSHRARPSSVASNSSSNRFAVSASLLSPSLASALGIGVDGNARSGKSHNSSNGFYANAHSASCTSLTGMAPQYQHHYHHRAPRPRGGSDSDERRPSLPNVLLAARRMSVVSVASFDSLAEEDQQQSALMLPPPSLPAKAPGVVVSPPTSPTAASSASASARRTTLKRALTSPSAPDRVVSWDEKMRKRGLVTRELLTTERAFVESLRILQDSFYQPLMCRCGPKGSPNLSSSAPAGDPILSRKAIAEIFSNFADILRLNTELLQRLEERLGGQEGGEESQSISAGTSTAFPSTSSRRSTWDAELDCVGDILVPIAPFLKMYSLYVKNFSSALARIETERRENEAFAKFLRDTERSTWGRGKAFFGLGLQAHLLTVVQRIPRYTLLVGDLLKSTPPGHPDHADIKRAYEMVERVASSINENVRQHEMDMLMLSLQRSLTGLPGPLIAPGRKLLKRGALQKACRKDVQPRAFFLFTDCIIYARPTGGGVAAIEATWGAIARAAGGAESSHASAAESLPPRTRVSSGALFSSTALLDVLQPANTHLQLQFREKYPLQDVTVISIEDAAGAAAASTSASASIDTSWPFELRTPDKSFAVYAPSAQVRQEWMGAIREARNEWMQARRTLRTEEDSVDAKRDRRRSVAAAAAAAKARQSVYSMALPNPSIPEGIEGCDITLREPTAGTETPLLPLDVAALRRPSLTARSSLPSTTSFASLLPVAASTATPSSALRVLEDYNAPAWVPDSRADRCMACSEPFNLWRRKHHCRLCGRVVCYSCSMQRFVIASYEDGKEDTVARACDSCYEAAFPEEEEEEDRQVEGGGGADDAEDSVGPPSSGETRFSFPRAGDASASGSADGHAATIEQLQTGSDATVVPARDSGKEGEEGEVLPHALQCLALGETAKHNRSAQAEEDGDGDGDGDGDAPLPFPSKRAVNSPPPSRPRTTIYDFPPSASSSALSPPSAARIMIAQSHTSHSLSHPTSLLMPPVQAATSGQGTFRLSAPRITTPDATSERGPSSAACTPIDAAISGDPAWYGCNVAASSSRRSLALEGQAGAGAGAVGESGDYFGPVGHTYSTDEHAASTPTPEQQAAIKARGRKKPLVSAAARLSAYYGKATAGGRVGGGAAASGSPASAASPLRKASG
ncbi:hypothetical protein BDZ90DRAFT_233273 [Jaminaea rosea]|uniref:Dbl homology domain-containing protein n=1 Tax=Jaminaea rosea TaxID=1569628 RepID=A0A316ULK8_9BASI|nr:hypothetical protein BDZ90DRAFT_233273 [Jaminaea rosea]PWN26129.1 hypothetical protein BDZ90DRAFT_233273 [Jaminaea rosea]